MPVQDFQYISLDGDGNVIFGLGNLNNSTSLQSLLIQTIVKRILTVPGSDAFFPNIGSSIGNLYGNLNLEDVEHIKAEFPITLKSIQDQVIEEQEFSEDFLPEEALRSLTLKNIEFDKNSLAWLVSIIVTTEANQEIIINI